MMRIAVLALMFTVGQGVWADCDPDLSQKALNVLATEWRDMHSSSNRGNCWTQLMGSWGDPFIFKHQATAAESDEIDEHKQEFDRLAEQFPRDPKARGYDHNNGHKLLMAYAAYLENYAKEHPRESAVANASSSWTKTRSGNCGEISASLYQHIYNTYSDLEIAQVRVPGGDHQFVLVKNDCGIFIVDGWTDEGQAIGPLRMSGSRLVDAAGNIPVVTILTFRSPQTTSAIRSGVPRFTDGLTPIGPGLPDPPRRQYGGRASHEDGSGSPVQHPELLVTENLADEVSPGVGLGFWTPGVH